MVNYLQTIETFVTEKTMGGFPISAYGAFFRSDSGEKSPNNEGQSAESFDSFVVKGGGITNVPVEGISKIKHLYVPVGLVMFPHTTLHCQNIHKNTEADILEDTLFDKLFLNFTKTVDNNHRKTKKHRRFKVPATLSNV